MADPGPNKKLAQLFRMMGASDGERRAAFVKLESEMRSRGINWSDIGNAIERDDDPGKYTETELQEYGRAMRAEGVEAGIKIGQARASNGSGNGHGYTLPKDTIMAEYCHQQLGRLKSDTERDFISRVYPKTQRRANLSPGELGFLASVYIKNGGKV
jgi:hypothetical protein